MFESKSEDASEIAHSNLVLEIDSIEISTGSEQIACFDVCSHGHVEGIVNFRFWQCLRLVHRSGEFLLLRSYMGVVVRHIGQFCFSFNAQIIIGIVVY
jgi:hypothetical protein